jgi:hypothetical protein
MQLADSWGLSHIPRFQWRIVRFAAASCSRICGIKPQIGGNFLIQRTERLEIRVGFSAHIGSRGLGSDGIGADTVGDCSAECGIFCRLLHKFGGYAKKSQTLEPGFPQKHDSKS